ncbi:MoaD/ThiS family protein [Arthrobacter sp. TMN-37]
MDSVTVLIPTLLRPLVEGRSEVVLPAEAPTTVGGVLDQLCGGRPALHRKIRDETGALRRYVNVYVEGEDVRRLRLLETPVEPGDTVMVIQSVAGG